jgi:hypothetical protein
MQLADIVIVAIIVIVIVAALWLTTSARGRARGGGDLIATWLAMSLVVFIVGGGLAMFGVAVVYIMLGQDAGRVGLVLLAIGLVLEPFVVALILRRRRGGAAAR